VTRELEKDVLEGGEHRAKVGDPDAVLGQTVNDLSDEVVAGMGAFLATQGAFRAVGQGLLAQLAQILAVTYLAEDSKVQRALNLDGGSSSAFWFRRDGDAFSISEVKSVRDFVGIVLKKD
jgi:hypothetical protein